MGVNLKPNPLRALAEYHRPDRARVLADRKAKRDDMRRRRLYRYAFMLWRELDAREIAGDGLHESERFQLMTTLVAMRRALAAYHGRG